MTTSLPTTYRSRPWWVAVTSGLGVGAELLLGARCPGCGRPMLGLCPDCRYAVRDRRPRTVMPQPCPDDFPLTLAASPFDPILRQLITAHKDRQAWHLSHVLGERLAVCVTALIQTAARLDAAPTSAGGRVVLVPVPSSKAAVRSRGRDATRALAARAARELRGDGLDVDVGCWLGPARRIADQSGLSRADRARNVRGAFRVRGRPENEDRFGRPTRVVVVDDLTTTGSTLLEATRTLGAAGLDVFGAAVVAATERRHPVTALSRADQS